MKSPDQAERDHHLHLLCGAVIGMILQSNIGDAGYAITGLAVAALLIFGIMDFNEIRNAISAPIILMSAGVIASPTLWAAPA